MAGIHILLLMEQVIKVYMSFPGISYFKELSSANTGMVGGGFNVALDMQRWMKKK